MYLDIPGAGGAAAPDEGEVVTGHARLQVHSQTKQIQYSFIMENKDNC